VHSLAEPSSVTLEVVARHAGVSLATASRVLNGTNRAVKESYRDRVLAAARELNYTANAHAQALARSTSSTVGVILHDVADPYFASIAGGIMRAAQRHDLLVMMSSTLRDPDRELAYVSTLHAQRARAILLIGSGFGDKDYQRRMAEQLTAYRASGGRVACVSNHSTLPADVVAPENREGAVALAQALLDQGHRRFAVVSGPSVLITVRDRLAGFQSALAEAGVDLPDSHVVDGQFTRDGGYAAMSELLDRDLDATAVFVLNDVMAMGALSACTERGVRVPDDLSVAGFDDIPTVRDLTPALTTVRLPLDELGERALELAMSEPRKRRRIQRIHGEVVLRDSTGPPRRKRRR
jgi:LacI family transcriptional regulator, galactose operon repressor